MEQDTLNSRKQHPHLGAAIICAVIGLGGMACFQERYGVSIAFAMLAAGATVILVAYCVDRIVSRSQRLDDSAPSTFTSWSWPRVQFSLRTMIVILIVAQSFLGLGIWNQRANLGIVFGGYQYGFPFRCVTLYPSPNGNQVTVDFLWLTVDALMGAALVVGIVLEARSLEDRR